MYAFTELYPNVLCLPEASCMLILWSLRSTNCVPVRNLLVLTDTFRYISWHSAHFVLFWLTSAYTTYYKKKTWHSRSILIPVLFMYSLYYIFCLEHALILIILRIMLSNMYEYLKVCLANNNASSSIITCMIWVISLRLKLAFKCENKKRVRKLITGIPI